MSRQHDHAVGDTVFVVDFHGRPTTRTKVTAVRSYKRGPKVTTANGSEWDVRGGCMWGSRGSAYYTGPRLMPASDELETAFRVELALSDVRWAEGHFRELTTEQQLEIGALLRRVRRGE